MDQTVSRRFEPSSRTTLMGEQPNPSDLLQTEDVMSRHRNNVLNATDGLFDRLIPYISYNLLNMAELLHEKLRYFVLESRYESQYHVYK
jgi:hypothetical protein